LRYATGQEEAKRDSFPLVLERRVELEDQQQILNKEAINYYLLQMLPPSVKKMIKSLLA